jgi:hypothetical protein
MYNIVQKLHSIYERWYYREIICKKGIENWPFFHEQIFSIHLVQIPYVTPLKSRLRTVERYIWITRERIKTEKSVHIRFHSLTHF